MFTRFAIQKPVSEMKGRIKWSGLVNEQELNSKLLSRNEFPKNEVKIYLVSTYKNAANFRLEKSNLFFSLVQNRKYALPNTICIDLPSYSQSNNSFQSIFQSHSQNNYLLSISNINNINETNSLFEIKITKIDNSIDIKDEEKLILSLTPSKEYYKYNLNDDWFYSKHLFFSSPSFDTKIDFCFHILLSLLCEENNKNYNNVNINNNENNNLNDRDINKSKEKGVFEVILIEIMNEKLRLKNFNIISFINQYQNNNSFKKSNDNSLLTQLFLNRSLQIISQIFSSFNSISNSNLNTQMNIQKIEEELNLMIGFGEGSTPSGDDFITGFSLAYFCYFKRSHHQNPPLFPLPFNFKKTTELSQMFLSHISIGKFPEELILLTDHLISQNSLDDRYLSTILSDIISHGKTSGVDTLSGYFIGFLFFRIVKGF